MRIINLGYVPFQWLKDSTPEEWHAAFQRNDVQESYRALVRLVVRRGMAGDGHTPADYLYQREPNLRIHPPGGVCVPWHTDEDFGHLVDEWNAWIPLTETTDDSQRLWVDWDGVCPGPIRVPLASAFLFRGSVMKHGNLPNATEKTRVSFDFRLLEKDWYRDTGAKTVLYGVPLRVPEYWSEMHDD